MGFRLVALLLVLALVSISTLGCGLLGFGGDDESEESLDLDMIQFSDDVPSPEPEEEVAFALSIDPDILVEIHFLYNFQVRLEGLRQVVRDLHSMLDYSGPGDIDLDWVAEVHEVTRESDDYFKVLTSLDVPVSQREQYQYLYIGMLESIKVSGYGADRLLAAAVIVGPSGRSMLNMSEEEIDAFQTLMRESRFFLSDAERLVDRRVTEVGRSISGLRLR